MSYNLNIYPNSIVVNSGPEWSKEKSLKELWLILCDFGKNISKDGGPVVKTLIRQIIFVQLL